MTNEADMLEAAAKKLRDDMVPMPFKIAQPLADWLHSLATDEGLPYMTDENACACFTGGMTVARAILDHD